jgi:tRNA (cmo5U34)-methyltransferase
MNPFKFENVKDFDQHIASSIPTFADLNYLVTRLINDFSQENTQVIDIGCSTGKLLRSLPKRAHVSYLGIDKVMDPTPTEGVTFIKSDIFTANRENIQNNTASVVISLFTMQFLPFNQRKRFINLVNTLLVDGGLFICAEKVHMNDRSIEAIVQANLLEWKKQHFSDTEILEKTISLKSIMFCQTEHNFHKELLKIGTVENIWQWGQFVCKVVRKLKGSKRCEVQRID